MEEQEYKSTYYAINKRRCVFEKAVSTRRCTCVKSLRFHLADREGVACESASGNAVCAELISRLRHNARFSLHLTSTDAPLPHAKEIRVQIGGLLGLQGLLHPELSASSQINNVIGLTDSAIQRYGRLEDLPYDVIVQAIVKFQGRKKRPHADNN
ncbi:MAG: hypothetical protein WBN51_11880 [Gammaproteobacteria bacterium]